MEQNLKGIIVIVIIILVLFAGGLYYIFKENQNRTVVMNYVQQYIKESDSSKRDALQQEIERRIAKKPIALTSQASFGSFQQLIDNGYACDLVAQREQFLDPLNESRTYDQIWRDCMDHPEQITPTSYDLKPRS